MRKADEIVALEDRCNELFSMLPADEVASANGVIDRLLYMDYGKMVKHFKSRIEVTNDKKALQNLKDDIQDVLTNMQDIVNGKTNKATAIRSVITALVSAGLFAIPFVGIASMTAFIVKRTKDMDEIRKKLSAQIPGMQQILTTVKQKIERIK